MHATKDIAWNDEIARKFSDGTKITGYLKMRMFEILTDNPACRTRLLLEQIAEIEGPVPLTVRHVNRLRLEWGFGGKRGRPAKREPVAEGACRNKDLVEIRPRVSHAGLHLFDVWLETTDALCDTIRVLQETIRIYKEDNPDDSFPLLNHGSETLERRFKALLFASLFGIGKLTEYDIKEHALETIIGRGYQSSTLNQFLGQLERVGSGRSARARADSAGAGSRMLHRRPHDRILDQGVHAQGEDNHAGPHHGRVERGRVAQRTGRSSVLRVFFLPTSGCPA